MKRQLRLLLLGAVGVVEARVSGGGSNWVNDNPETFTEPVHHHKQADSDGFAHFVANGGVKVGNGTNLRTNSPRSAASHRQL
jgi:hypothetical protein